MLLRQSTAHQSQDERLRQYEIFSQSSPSLTETKFRIEGNFVIVNQHGREITFPSPLPLVKQSHIVFGYEQWLQRKYCLPGFVEIQPGDVVVDCGAYVGGFSLSASRIASQLHAFEPDRDNAACTRRNLAGFNHVHVNECGLYDKSDEMVLNISASSVEHSLLLPDDGTVVEQRRIPVISLADYARIHGIDHYDFVKIEAEGVELEVFAGLRDMRPRQIAIDVSPERNNESPAEEFRHILESIGYEVRQRGHVMFARIIGFDPCSLNQVPHQQLTINTLPTNQATTANTVLQSTISKPLVAKPKQTLLTKLSRLLFAQRNAKVPRIIYSLWLQGMNNAPDLVKLNFARWAKLNPGYHLNILDQAAAEKFLADESINLARLTPQALSDVLRAKLLSTTGGIWVDASLFPTQPLDNWLRSKITTSGFFAFERPGPDRPVSSWFLAATKHNAMMQAWWNQVLAYWSTERVAMQTVPENPVEAVEIPGQFPYFWFHYLFQLLLERDTGFANAWAACHKIQADAPHALQVHFANDGLPTHAEITQIIAGAPVHKLNWRANYPIEILSAL